MPWRLSYRASPLAVAVYDRHYSRRPSSVGAMNVAPPGECLILLTEPGDALWVSSFQRFPFHRWGGAWLCTVFRNESSELSSWLIRRAVAATVAAWGPIPRTGFVTFVDAGKTRRKRDPGRCFVKAGWRRVGETVGGLEVLRLSPSPCPLPQRAIGAPLTMFA